MTQILAGRYQIIRFLGKKVNKFAYLALDRKHDCQVAIHHFPTQNIEQIQRLFAQEYKILSALKHPQILQIKNLIVQDAQIFIITELAKNIVLKHLIKKNPAFTLSACLQIAEQMSRALLVLHEAGVVHGNLHSSKFFIGADNSSQIFCCGIEKFLPFKENMRELAYLSPEELQGMHSKTSDIFHLGIILYQLFSWSLMSPFADRDRKKIVENIRSKSIPEFSQIGNTQHQKIWHDLSGLIQDATKKTKEERISDVRYIIEKLKFLRSNLSHDAEQATNNNHVYTSLVGTEEISVDPMLAIEERQNHDHLYTPSATNEYPPDADPRDLLLDEEPSDSTKRYSPTFGKQEISSQSFATKTSLQENDFFAHYRIISKLGEGGMGVVFRVEDTKLQREVALKLIQPKERISDEEIKRFLIEAKANAQLEHPNIVRLLEIGEHPLNYFTMEYIDGYTLKEITQQARLDYKKIANLLSQIANALQLAHSKNIIHRDIKPGNIIVDLQGTPKVMDFGLAKLENANTQVSRTGDVMGTPAYMSPEQVNADKIDHRSDIYSMGATLYELVTGRPVFEGASNVNIWYQVLSSEPIAPRQLNPDIPIELEAICLKCLEKSPSRRYPSMQMLSQDLQSFISGESLIAKPPNVVTHVRKFLLRNLTLSIATGIVLLTILCGGVFSYRQWTVAEHQRKFAEQATVEAQQQRQLAEQQKTAKTLEARTSSIILAKIALTKAVEAYKNEKWRECGIFAGTSLEFIKNLEGKDVRAIKNQAKSWVCQAIFQQKLLWTNVQHQDNITCVDISIANRIITGSLDRTVKIWNMETGALWKDFSLPAAVTSVGFGPNGTMFACALQNQTVQIRDTNTGKILYKNKCAPNPSSIRFSSDNRLVTFLTQGKIYLWDFATDKTMTFDHPSEWVKFVDFDASGKKLLAISEDHNLRIWDIETGNYETRSLGNNFISQVCLSYDRKKLIVVYENKSLKIWNIEKNSFSNLLNHAEEISNVALSPDDKMLAIAFNDNEIRIVEIAGNNTIEKYSGHSQKITAMQFTPNSKGLISVSQDKTIRHWFLNKQVFAQKSVSSQLGKVAFSQNGLFVAAQSLEGKYIEIWDAYSGQSLKKLNYDDWIKHWCFKNDDYLLMAQKDHVEVVNWQTNDKKYIAKHQNGIIQHFSYNAQKDILATVSRTQNLFLWDTIKNTHLGSFEIREGIVGICISPNAEFVVCCSPEKIYTVDLLTKEMSALGDNELWVQSCMVSPNNKILATTSADKSIHLWNLQNKKTFQVLKGHEGLIHNLQFSQDNQKLLSSDLNKRCILWNIDFATPLKIANGHYATIDHYDKRMAIVDVGLRIENLLYPTTAKYDTIPQWSKNLISQQKYHYTEEASNFNFRQDLPGVIIEQGLQQAPLQMARYLFELRPTDTLAWEIDDAIFSR